MHNLYGNDLPQLEACPSNTQQGYHLSLRRARCSSLPEQCIPLKLCASHFALKNVTPDKGSTLRLSYSVAQRSLRIFPQSATSVQSVRKPPGYAVWTETSHTCHNVAVIADINMFLPNRGITKDRPPSKMLGQFNVAFSRGGRRCAGMN
jgi:hypothetical protein